MKAKILDVFKRLTEFDKSLGIITNGDDNAYGERSERYIINSVTAKTAANTMATYLAGKGFGDDYNKIKVNKEQDLMQFTHTIAKSISKNRGVWIHVNYDANFDFANFKVLPYTHCRLGKKDATDYSGKVLIHPDWVGSKSSDIKKNKRVIDVFNPNKKVVESQIIAAKGIENYKGQVLYFNLDNEYDYALSQIDPVMNDCDSEAQAAVFKNRSLRRGFFGKTMIVTKALIGNLEDYTNAEEFAEAKSEREDFKQTIKDFHGAENVGGSLHIELEEEGDLNNAIKVENITTDINDKLFAYTEESVFKNILMAFNNIPLGLVRSDNSLFSANGDSLQVMKESYQENTMLEREALEYLINKLVKGFNKIEVERLEIIPLIDKKIVSNDQTNNKD